MNLLIKSAEILDAQSSHYQSKVDLHITDGVIKEIGRKLSAQSATIIEGKNLKVSQGWVDLRAHFNDPGEEQKEDLNSGCAAAMAAGFTKVLLMPNTLPTVDQKSAVEYILRASHQQVVDLLPCAAVTRKTEGKELTEILDLNAVGAAAFSDGLVPIWHTDIMLKALQYVQKFSGLLINRAEDQVLTAFGQMNEGEVSTELGMKGMPALAEVIMIERDLRLLEYAGGRLHLSMISSAESVDLIRKAKKAGLKVTADVGVNYLKYTEQDAAQYETNFKVNPPYRTEKDRKALIKGVLDGTIDAIVSDHQPQDEESKKLEFDLAEFGSNNLQGFWPILNEVFGDQIDKIIPAITTKARQVLGLGSMLIEEGEKAELTIFDDHSTWDFNTASNQSKSDYSPLLGTTLKGSVKAVINGRHFHINT